MAINFAAGVWLASRFFIAEIYPLLAMAASAVAFALTYQQKNKFACLAALMLFFCGLGALRQNFSVAPNQYQKLFDTKQQLEGYIVEDIDMRQANQFLTIQPKGFGQRILVSAPTTADYFYGDWVVASGKIQQPQNFDDFDYQKYLERYNVYATMSYPKILVLKGHQQNFVKEWLLDIKWAFTRRVDKLLPEPQSSLLMGILIGARKTLPPDVVNNFNATGVSHVIAISGYNITIIVSALGYALYFLGRRSRFWLTLGVIVGFVILSGASASVIRAAIMGGLVLLSAIIGRQYSVGPSLFFAALIMLLLNPRILFWDASFQLSFLATLGIVYFLPLLERLTDRWDNVLNIKSILLTTLSAILFTLPLILFTFGRLSVVAPLVNILILPIVPLTMLLGFLTVLPVVGAGCAFAVSLFLRYMLSVTAAFAHVPYGSLAMKISQYDFLALGLGVLFLYVWLKRMVVKRLNHNDTVQVTGPFMSS